MLKAIRNIILGLVGTFFLLVLLIYVLSLGRHDSLTQILAEALYESTGADLEIGDVNFRYLSNFPYLTMELDDVLLHSPDFPEAGRELINAEMMAIQIRPISLLRKVPRIRSIILRDGKLMLYRTAEGKMNLLGSGKKKARALPSEGDDHRDNLLSIDLLHLERFQFQYLDSMRTKNLQVTFVDTRVRLDDQRPHPQALVVGTWFFDGLAFKIAKGGYLEQTEVIVDLGVEIQPDSSRLRFLPSTVQIAGQPFRVDGKLELTQPAYLALNLHTQGIPYPDLLPLLTPALQQSLAKFELDGQVDGSFHLAGPLLPGLPAPVSFTASGRDGHLDVGTFSIDSLAFQADFHSHCDTSRGPAAPIDCLNFDTVSGRLLGYVPFGGRVELFDLKDPLATVDARIEVPLQDLDALLPGDFSLETGVLSAHVRHRAPLSAYGPGAIDPDAIELAADVHLKDGRVRTGAAGAYLSGVNGDIRLENNNLLIDEFTTRVNGDRFRILGEVDQFLPALLDTSRQVDARLRVYTPDLDLDHFLGDGQSTRPKKAPKKAKGSRWNGMAEVVDNILARGEASLDVYAGVFTYGRFSANQVGFNCRLREACPGGTGRCLELNDLQARIYDVIPLEADLTIRNPQDPQLELQASLAVQLEDLNSMLPDQNLVVERGNSRIDLSYAGSMNDFLDTQEFGLIADVAGELRIDSLALSLDERKYQLENVEANLGFDEKNLSLRNLSGRLNGIPIRASGQFDGVVPFVFLPERPVNASIEVYSPYIDFEALPFLATSAPRDTVRAPKETGLTRTLDSLLAYLDLSLGVRADSLRYHNFFAERVAFTTRYEHVCADRRGNMAPCLEVDSFRAFLLEAIPLEANIRVFELEDPIFQFDGNVDLPLTNLNQLLPPEQMVFHRGRLRVDFDYTGQPHNHFDQQNVVLNADLAGRAQVVDGAFDYVASGYRIEAADFDLAFDQDDLQIDRLDLTLNDNPLQIEGKINELVPFILSPDQPLDAHLSFHSPHFVIDNFSAPKNREHLQPDEVDAPSQLKVLIDSTLSQIQANIKLAIDTVSYRNFRSTGVRGEVLMDAKHVELDSLRMEVAGGAFGLHGEISGLERDEPRIDVHTLLRNVDVHEVFQAFDNFGQDGLTHENIQGILDADIRFRAQANNNYDLDPASFQGEADITIREGELIDLPMFRDMNSILFRGRNMEDIRFAELENTFQLDGRHFHIDYFNIYSSVVTFGVEGRLCFDQHAHTDMLVTVPLSNLFRKNVSQAMLKEYRDSGQIGTSIYLRLRGKKEKLKVAPTFTPKRFHRLFEPPPEEPETNEPAGGGPGR